MIHCVLTMRSEVQERVAPEALVVEEVTAADVLEHAADLLGEWGWLQCEWGGKHRGAFCMGGAIFEAVNDLVTHDRLDLDDEAKRYAHDLCDGSFVKFNNARGRTKAEVVAKLREAAATPTAPDALEGTS